MADTTHLKSNLSVNSLSVTTPLTKANANESLKREHICVPLAGGLLLVDGTTYSVAVPVARACSIKKISVAATIKVVGGTNTLAVTKNGSTTLLSTATVDPTAVPASANAGEALSLTATSANLDLAAGDAIVVTLVCGTMTTDGKGYCVLIELENADA